MMIRTLLLVALAAIPATAAMQNEPLHALIENSSVASQSYGAKHPKVLLLHKEIDRRLNNGERIDVEAIEQRLIGLVAERAELRKRYGGRHPKTIDNARRIHAVSEMLISAE